jgi:pimeloyl-ACP methyl ester carboxylesterase
MYKPDSFPRLAPCCTVLRSRWCQSGVNVVGLVYVAAFAPDKGESLADIESDSKDSVLKTALMQLQYPTGQGAETAVEFAIDPTKFHDAFAADLPAQQTALMVATQRPFAESGFSEPTGVPAWKNLPSWAVVPTGDKAAGSDVVRSMAERAGATITEVDASHVPMMSQPQVVTDVILTALAAAQNRPSPPRAIDFHTWRSLERGSGLSREEAVDTMLEAVRSSVSHSGTP